MEKVVLSKAAREKFGARLGRPVPRPDSEEFDELLEELREMQPDVYTELVGALEYKGELLPVEREALRAQKRAQRQRIADHIKNRKTHDGKRVPDKRKSLVLGGILAASLMAWMGYTNVSRAFLARAAPSAEEPAIEEVVAEEADAFGVVAQTPELGEDLNIPENVQVKPRAPSPPPRNAPPAPPEELPAETAPAGIRLPFGMGGRGTPEDEPEDDLPPAPGPPQPSVANAPPPSPYLPPQPGATPAPGGEATPLPANLSFVPPEAAPEGPLNVLSTGAEGEGNTGLPSAPGTTLAATSTLQGSTPAPDAPPPTSLSTGEPEAEPAPATTLGWEDAEDQGSESTVEERNLSFPTDSRQAALSESAATSAADLPPLPPVPQVGRGVPPPPTTQTTAPGSVQPQPTGSAYEVTDLSALLTPGTPLQAELVTGVAAADGASMPVLAKTTGNWCGAGECPEITWIGEASYPGADRLEIAFSRAVVGNTVQSVSARAFGGDQLPGVPAGVRDAAPTAVQDLVRGAVGGAADYLDALNSRETVIIKEGEIVREPSEPDLGNYLLQRGTELFSLPTDQTSMVRLAELAPGTSFTVMYGLQ